MNKRNHDIVAVGGYWEPLAFYRRSGGWFADDAARHAACFTREAARCLGELAVTAAVWPGYKGFGLQHERPEWERLKPFRKFLEQEGIELGVYLQCGTYFAETFYRENPQARKWTALDYWGKPQPYSEYYRIYYRHRPCLTHRAFSDYVGRVAQILVKEYGVTFFYADNNAQMPCYTPHFQRAFHAFLRRKYRTHTPEGRARFARRYGHPHVNEIVLPYGSARRPLESLHALKDPGLQDWVEFRCRLTAQNAAIIAAAAKRANPRARLCFNLAYDYGEFHQLVWGTEPEFMASHVDFLFSEDANHPRVTSDGRLISHVHTCKHLRALGLRGHFHAHHFNHDATGRRDAILGLLELAVHNQGCLGAVYFNPHLEAVADDPRPATIRFIRRHAEVFTDNHVVADLVVLRGRHAGTINWLEATEGRLLAQQALYQAGFQFDNVIETNLDDLQRYRLLVLPETVSVPGHCVRQIADYVRNGGRVLAVGHALACDEWGRRRLGADVTPLHGERSADYGNSGGDRLEREMVCAWLGVEGPDRESVFTFPRLIHPRPYLWDPDEQRAPVLNDNYHALPVNQAAFIAAVRRALGQPPVVEVLTPESNPYVIPTLLQSKHDGRLSLHVLNYRPESRVKTMAIRLRLPKDQTPRGGRLIGLEASDSRPVTLTEEDGSIALRLPAFDLYAGLLLDREPGGRRSVVASLGPDGAAPSIMFS